MQCNIHPYPLSNFLIAPSQRTIGIIHTAQSRRATGPPNPSAEYIRRTKGGRYRSSGGAYVSLKMAPVDFDSPAAASGDVTRYDGPGVVSSGGMGGPCSSVLGGGCGNRIQVVPATESSLLRLFGTPLAFATFSPRAMRDPHASRDDSVGAPIVAATFLLRVVRDANTPFDGSIDAPLVAASFLSRAMCGANASPDGSVGTPLLAATFSPCVMQTPPLTAMLAHPS
jgi:hypothetical protein